MLLNEFFGKPIDVNKELSKNKNDQSVGNNLFWYIIDHDKLHKDYFHDLAKTIKNPKTQDKEYIVKEFMPMVRKGCREFYHHAKMTGRFEEKFTKEMMQDMCERLYDHYREDVIKGKYKVGK
jgi:hypothetical protein